VSCRTKAGIQHGADGTFAIGSGDMDETQTLVRIPNGFEEPKGIFEPELDSSELAVVQPFQRLLEIHFVPR
jgi:hypothetical protein